MIDQETARIPHQWSHMLPTYRSMTACVVVIAIVFCVLLMYAIPYTSKVPPSFIWNSVKTQQKIKTSRTQKHHKEQCKKILGGIVIGAAKGGTRALLNYLALHPQVRTSPHEVNFFDQHYTEGLEWYKNQMPFNCDDQIITMEKTPAYFIRDYVPERVARMNSSVKLLLTVRDPVERTLSSYLQVKEHYIAKTGKTYPTFENQAFDNSNGKVKARYEAIKGSLYYLHMLPWLKQFPLKQIHIVSAEELVQSPYAVIKGIEQYLGLDPWIASDMFYFNKTRGFYCYRKDGTNTCLNEGKGRPHPPMPLQEQTKLQEYFHDWNEKFYKLVGKDFGWQ